MSSSPAPEWVVSDCGLTETWPDYDDQEHLPIWNACLWNHLMTLWRTVFIDWNLRADPRLLMLYAPGAFTWCEFDFEIIEQAAEGGLSFAEFGGWFQPAMLDMVDIFNGDNDDPYYAVVMSNLKALQMRVNRLYVVPSDSYMDQYPDHWHWVRLSLGHNPKTSPDAWAALRESNDRYWIDDDSHSWNGKPWVHNLEHFLVQRDVEPDAVSRRGTDVRSGEVDPENGTAYEGRRTDRAAGQNALAFFVDDAFLSQPEGSIELKITYSDTGRAQWMVQYPGTDGVVHTSPVTNTDSGVIRTATFILEPSDFDGSLTGNADLRIVTDIDDVEIRFVRLVKMLPPEPPTARKPRGGRSP